MDLDAAIGALGGGKPVQRGTDADLQRARALNAPLGDESDRPVSDAQFMANAVQPEGDDLSGAIDALSGAPAKAAAAPAPMPKNKNSDLFEATYSDPLKATAEVALNQASGLGSTILGGLKGLAEIGSTMAAGGSFHDAMKNAADTVQATQQSGTYQPEGTGAKLVTEALGSKYNPMNWYGIASNWLGEKSTDIASKAGASPEAAAGIGVGVNTTLQALPLLLLARQASKTQAAAEAQNEVVPAGKPRIKPKATAATQAAPVATEAQSAGATSTQLASPGEQAERAATLQRIGLENKRMSAITGDKLAGATDAQVARFTGEKAGVAAAEQFQAERTALENHATQIIRDTGGSVGLDEKALHARGRAITAPLDGLEKVLTERTSQLYKTADERAAGSPIVSTDTVDGLLKNPDFRETLLAKDQGGLLGSIERQLERFKGAGENGLSTVASAENFRKWLNSVWTPENSATLGKVKNAIDEDVFKAAGDDVYAAARQLHAIKKATLDSPTGISKIMDFDPRTPVNRAVAFENIPDYVTRLPLDQFEHVTGVLRNIASSEEYPAPLRAQANGAIAEIKAHMANQVLEAGSKYKGQWNAKGVSAEIADNAAKLNGTFTPAELAKLKDLNDAGHILSVDQSYPGAAAQASNVMKRGIMSSVVRKAGAPIGGTLGSIFGPAGAAAGATAGELAAEKGSVRLGEMAALKRWRKGIVKDLATQER